ncbi:GNAT family N-acetyltransferase [Streptomyces sp. NPDC005648]|uniref:GNAT family N-acetyltransferase n=1 Tax=Streptomyces sp. NPDC005648 TaxID=3157044 RepID=UPI0033B1D1F4
MTTGTLRSPRLDLLPLRVEHAPEMAAVLADPALHSFIGGSPASPEALRLRYERLVAGSPDPSVSWCNWVLGLRENARLVGTVQATVTGATAEIAWVVGTPWQGRGYALEAARALVAHLRNQPTLHTVIAHIHPDHHASEAVARAAGLTPTDKTRTDERRWHLPLTRPPENHQP